MPKFLIQPNELMPPATAAGRLVREAVMPLDWRLQHAAIEFTDDLENVSAVLTRKQLEIEPE
ncbi:hypothetical protein FM036_43405 [Nostoc sp. HG1]|nr:hypothetical protein [Nostoc sp. HG1]